MSDRDHYLHGAEDVRSAASTMSSAADSMRSAASTMDSAASRMQQTAWEQQTFLTDWLARLEGVLYQDREARNVK